MSRKIQDQIAHVLRRRGVKQNVLIQESRRFKIVRCTSSIRLIPPAAAAACRPHTMVGTGFSAWVGSLTSSKLPWPRVRITVF